jgi:enoyl-CoA hydratase/carnithine racemase
MEKPMTDSVIVTEHSSGEWVIGQLTLNVEKTLNSLTREMVDIISDQLAHWAANEQVVAVLIDGAGE